MGKYLDKKNRIESALKATLTGAAAVHNAAVDATADLSSKARSERLHELADHYKQSTESARETAIFKERDLFDAFASDVEKALTQPPSDEALRFLDALALNPAVTQADVDAAAISLKGNAAAESTLNGIAEKNGLTVGFAPVPSIAEVLSDLKAYQDSRARAIRTAGATLGNDWKVDEWGLDMFSPEASSKAFDRAEGIVEQYGTE